jgi:tetratricopeptide (TPR) repeat protein
MLEMLLRLLGFKRKRRKVYVQTPVPGNLGQTRPSIGQQRRASAQMMPNPPGTVQDAPAPLMQAAADQAAEAARRQAARREQKAAGPLGGLLGGLLGQKKKRHDSGGVAMPLKPGQVQTRRALSPEDTALGPARPARPKRTFRQSMAALRREVAASWSGPMGRGTIKVARFSLIYLLPAAVVGVPAYLVLEEMRAIGIEVQPISVPESVARSGRTPEVLAQLLIDQIEAVRKDASIDHADRWPRDTAGRPVPMALAAEPDTLRGIAVWLRNLTPNPVRTISGSVTELPNGTLDLQLYMSGMNKGAAVAALSGFDPSTLPGVVAGAAPLILRASTPRLYAWYLYSRTGRPEQLQAQLSSLLTDPASGSVERATQDTVEFLSGLSLARGGRLDEAKDLSARLLARSPGYPPAHYLQAVILAAGSDHDGARLEVERARTLDGNTAWSFKIAGRLLNEAGKPADALNELRTARRLDPADGEAVVLEANTLITMRRMEEAAQVVRAGLEKAPGHPGVQEVAANLMFSRGRPDMALGFIDGELRIRPERISAMLTKARILIAMRRGADALLLAEAALRLNPSSGVAQMTRGYAMLATQRPTQALAVFDTLLQAAPDMPALLQGKAAALVQLDRKPEAVALLERVLEIIPDNRNARTELDRIEGRPPPAPRTSFPPPGPAAAPPGRPAPAAPVREQAAPLRVAPVDVGPAPAPRPAPAATPGTAPAAAGAFGLRPGAPQPQGDFRRPDSEPPAP